MSRYGQFLFWQQKEALETLVEEKAPRTALVAGYSGLSLLIVTDPKTGNVLDEPVSTLGVLPPVGSRVLLLELGDTSLIAIPVTENAAMNLPGIASYQIQPGRVVYLTTTIGIPGSMTGITLTANRLYYVPVWIPKGFSVSGFIFEVVTAVSGQVQIGIYSNNVSFTPQDLEINSAKATYGATGVKQHSITAANLAGPRWVWVGLCSTTAMAIRGLSSVQLPSFRGGSDAGGINIFLMCFQDLTAGWTDLPAVAAAGSGPANTYLHVGILD